MESNDWQLFFALCYGYIFLVGGLNMLVHIAKDRLHSIPFRFLLIGIGATVFGCFIMIETWSDFSSMSARALVHHIWAGAWLILFAALAKVQCSRYRHAAKARGCVFY